MLHTRNIEAIRRIESAIGYTFRDKRLLVQVFTRKTYMKVDPEAPDNEVLEFYGDTLLSYHVTTYFVDKFAHMLPDGLYFMRTVEQFTEMRSHYVRNQYLTELIKELIPDIDKLVRAQSPKSELAKENQKAYADLFESLIGAVYLDSCQDEDFIRAFILHHLGIEPQASVPKPTAAVPAHDTVIPATPAAVTITPTPAVERPVRPATRKIAIKKVIPLEKEEIPTEKSDTGISTHTKILSSGTDDASSEKMLTTAMREKTPPLSALPAIVGKATALAVISPVDELAAFCRANGYDAPTYLQAEPNAPNARPVASCSVTFRNGRGKIARISLNDSGKTIDEAESKVAAKMLKKLQERAAPTDPAVPSALVETPAVPESTAAESPITPVVMVETPTVAETPETIQDKPHTNSEVSPTAPIESTDESIEEVLAAIPDETTQTAQPDQTAQSTKPKAAKRTPRSRKTPQDPPTSPATSDVTPESAPVSEQSLEIPPETAAETVAPPAKKPRGRRKVPVTENMAETTQSPTPSVSTPESAVAEPLPAVATDEPHASEENTPAPRRPARKSTPRRKKAAGE